MNNIDKNIDTLIREGEGLTVEFKERFTARIDEDIVAFTNTKGGMIFLGVRDDQTVGGEILTNGLKARINSVARNCSPSVPVKIKRVKDVVIIKVPEGYEKPYSCKAGYFRRLDGTTQKMTNYELRAMFRESEETAFEEVIRKDIGWNDISREKIKAFLEEAHVDIRRVAPRDILTSLNVAKDNKITNAGILFFAKNIRRFIAHGQMTLIAFKGRDRIHIFDRQDIADDLLIQFNAAILFLKKHLNLRSVIKETTREDIYEISLDVLREAITNAIIHRDYSMRGTSLMIEVYDDRIEITNPGGLPRGLQEKDLGRVSIRRNEIIADLFYRMGKGERAGTGIKRMNESMTAAGLQLPEIKHTTFYTIILRRPSARSNEEIPAGQRPGSDQVVTRLRPGSDQAVDKHAILKACLESAKMKELISITGFKHRTNFKKNYVDPLVNDGLLALTVPDKPSSPKQRYITTEKGRNILEQKKRKKNHSL